MNSENLTGIPKDGEKPGFTGVWIPAQIYEDKRLNSTDRDLYAQIAGFKNGCWVKSSILQERVGVSERTFQASCRKLKEYGYIDYKRMFGRVVRWVLISFQSSPSFQHPGKIYRDEPGKIYRDEPGKKGGVHIEQRKNKERTKNKGADAPANDKKENEETEQPEQYGNEQVNEFLKGWLEETGDDFSKVQRERRATWNLIKKLPPEALKPLLEAVGEARGSGDRFAPQIATPSDLVGKYSKLPKLRAWKARTQEEERQNREWIPDYNGELPAYAREPELSDQERERVLEKMREFRQGNHKWLKSRGEEDESE